MDDRERTIKELKGELKLRLNEIQHSQAYITELKDLLQTSVKSKPTEKRLGECVNVGMYAGLHLNCYRKGSGCIV